jgi:hypothetical protein
MNSESHSTDLAQEAQALMQDPTYVAEIQELSKLLAHLSLTEDPSQS